MTKKDRISREQELALSALYGDKIRDLTSEGYIEALAKLRRTSPNEARRVERLLTTLLKERFFHRRQKPWYLSSDGERARLKLLPENPYLEKDIRLVRKVLGIPDDQIKPTEDDLLWKHASKLVKRTSVRKVVEGNLAGNWHNLHVETASGRKVPRNRMVNLLSDSMYKSAINSARVNLHGQDIPDWLRVSPSGPALNYGSTAPIDWAAGRLVERYRLPWSTALALVFYILTENPEWVSGLEPIQIEITSESNLKDSEAFNISIKGIDEFITREDWQRVWINYIKPRQNYLWERRGMKPQGRRSIDILRLQKFMPLYRKLVQDNLKLKEVLGKPQAKWDDATIINIMTVSDQETIRRTIRDLDKLLTPIT